MLVIRQIIPKKELAKMKKHTHTFKIIFPYTGVLTAEQIMMVADDSFYNNADDYTGFDDTIPVYNDPSIKKPANINAAMRWLEDRGGIYFW